jgi:hypothetical protein
MWEPICWRVARRYAAQTGQAMPKETAEEFANEFFKSHSALHKFSPKKIVDKVSGGGGAHPEARQSGNEIWLYPKFWQLDNRTRDFVFAHELGHYWLSSYGLAKLVEELKKQGVDPWDSATLPFGQHNMDEAFADSFATYFLNRGELKHRYPEWDAVVHAVVG